MDNFITSGRYETLRRVLRTARTDAGLSQSEVADRISEPQSFVSKYESGVRRLDVVEMEQVAAALGTDLATLVRRFQDVAK